MKDVLRQVRTALREPCSPDQYFDMERSAFTPDHALREKLNGLLSQVNLEDAMP